MRQFIMLSLLAFVLCGCHPHLYHPSIEQGNIITDEMINQLNIGMTQKQVENIMGSPILQNTFNDNRVNYVYRFKSGTTKDKPIKKQVTLIFSQGKLTKIEK